MKEIKILHLFPHLLSLYGEYGNVSVLRAVLKSKGYEVSVTECEYGDAQYSDYDLVYVGSGTEDHIMVAAERLRPQAQKIQESIDAGKVWLATGNAMALFGKSLERAETVAGIGAFSYTTVIDDSKRYLGDVITAQEPATLGFINTSCIFTGIETPLMELFLNKELGNDKRTPAEGIREKNFFGTQLIGPFLVKNPHYMQQLCMLLTGEELTLEEDSSMVKAYRVACRELRGRAGLGA